MLRRRTLSNSDLGDAAMAAIPKLPVRCEEQTSVRGGVKLPKALPGEDVFAFLLRTVGRFDAARFKQVLGAANPFKGGDRIVGVAASEEAVRGAAQALLAAARIEQIESQCRRAWGGVHSSACV